MYIPLNRCHLFGRILKPTLHTITPQKTPKNKQKNSETTKKNKANQKPLKKQKKEINPHRNNEIDFHIYLFVQSHSYALCL